MINNNKYRNVLGHNAISYQLQLFSVLYGLWIRLCHDLIFISNHVIQDGRLHHSDLGSVWPSPKYRRDLIPWLLRLTEEYDLTFALKDSPISLVPCLLPNAEPEVGDS